MSRSRQHGSWPSQLPLRADAIKLLDASTEGAGIAADFVQANKAVKAVKGCILHRFGHDRSRKLLEAQGQLGFELAGTAQEQDIKQEIHQLGIEVGAVLLR